MKNRRTCQRAFLNMIWTPQYIINPILNLKREILNDYYLKILSKMIMLKINENE